MSRRKSCKSDPDNMINAPGNPSKKEAIPMICSRIRYYREKSGMEQKTLAKLIGTISSTVSNWENGRSRPDIDMLLPICEVFNISLYDLFGADVPDVRNNAGKSEFYEKYSRLSPGHRYAVDNLIDALISIEDAQDCPKLKMLLYFARSLAAGIGDPTEYDQDAEPVYVYETSETLKSDSIFRVNGDSMEPDFHDGQDVLVQRMKGNNDLEYGEIGAFIVGNETYIKKYENDGLHSLNPDYPVMRFEEENAVYLIGKVIGILPSEGYASDADVRKYKLIHGNDI